MTKRAFLFSLLSWGALNAVAQEAPPGGDTCLLFSAVAQGSGGNAFLYYEFATQHVKFVAGDALEYDLLLAASNPCAMGGVDVTFTDNSSALRDTAAADGAGRRAHPNSLLPDAVGKWLHRRIPLDSSVGKESGSWCAAFEGDDAGVYGLCVDNVAVTHADGTRTRIYEDGESASGRVTLCSGYLPTVLAEAVPRAAVEKQGGILDRVVNRQKRLLALSCLRLDLAERFLQIGGKENEGVLQLLRDGREKLKELESRNDLSDKQFNVALEGLLASLEPVGKAVKAYTGHLVGHAHIDSQWLWQWPETIKIFSDTFGQACKFMEEFPGFTFSQSSSSFYQSTEFNHPELFEKIRQYVREGRWELLGGQICETDLNFVGSESQAMHFLYGQRFFRERFEGKQAVVAFSPDTFGHNWQMPQIATLGGCKYYYFCRAGENIPLFWWEGADGTRVLAFQEVNSWYNSDVSPSQFDELIDIAKRTGGKDMLWIYGVGNHGGGPTRANLQVAAAWMKQPFYPTVKFSTAAAFFQKAAQNDLSRLPVVKDELNYVFTGCYTTHGDVKRWNDDAQAAAETAQSLAALAARHGFPYPGTRLRINWEDICWNHHHDTIDGSAKNEPYKKSRAVYERVIADSRAIAADAASFLAARIKKAAAGDLLVFNPTGMDRDAIVACSPRGGSMEGSGDSSPIQPCAGGRDGFFLARKLPPFGYRVYRHTTTAAAIGLLSVSADGTTLENECLKAVLDAATGELKSLLDKRSGKECLKPGGSANRLEVHWEQPSGMPAWDIGNIARVETLNSPVTLTVVESGPVRAAVEFSRAWREDTITQRVSLAAGAGMLECELRVDWKETGGKQPQWPFLRLAADLNVSNDVALAGEIPFGYIKRPANGQEFPAIHWVDVAGAEDGLSVFCDSKHGHSFRQGTLRLSLIRAPTYPDDRSDCYPQTVRYAFLPHVRDHRAAGTAALAAAYMHPPVCAVVPAAAGAGGNLSAELSFLRPSAPHMVITAVKRAEDDDDLIVRFYESHGEPGGVTLFSSLPIQSVKRANFIEDVLDATGETVAAKGLELSDKVRGFEIRTWKLKLKPIPDIEMTGTRGGGPKRDF